MSQVKKKAVDYPYVNLHISREEKDKTIQFIDNLKAVLKYIGSDEDVIHLGEEKILGRAYDKIFRRLNPNQYCKYFRKISKRQIKQLIRIHLGIQGYYIKIPYLIDYIFKAIFELVRLELKSGRDLPVNICDFVGDIRRNDFYKAQAKFYEKFCDGGKDMTELKEALNNDINGSKAVLSGKFI